MKFFPLLPALALIAALALPAHAAKETYYKADGTEAVIDTDALKEPTVLHDRDGRAVWVCPTQPVYVAKPSYGPGGIAGNSRRIGVQAARRVARAAPAKATTKTKKKGK